MEARKRNIMRYLAMGLAISGLIVGLYFMVGWLKPFWDQYMVQETHHTIIIVLYAILPLFGFPLSIFLLLLGIKFGLGLGFLIMACGMAVHVAVTFLAANSLLRPRIERFFEFRKYRLPQFSKKNFIWPSIIFIAVPGPPYAIKNWLLSLSGVPFRHYFWIGWAIQVAAGIPIVAIGKVAAGPAWVQPVILSLMALSFVVFFCFKQRKRHDKG